jgi:magnesium-transporting ATPase (P-type)
MFRPLNNEPKHIIRGVKSMKKNLDAALEDIAIIKDSIEQVKENRYRLYNILMIVGLINLVYHGASTIAAIFLDAYEYGKFYGVSWSLNRIAYAIFFIYYIKIYREEKFSSNKYYLSFLNIFGAITFLLPLIMYIIKMMSFVNISNEMTSNLIMQSMDMSMLSNILLLCFSAIMCGTILRKKSIQFLSIGILFVYMLLSLVYKDIAYTIGISETPASTSLLSIYYILAISVGYIIIAIILKYSRNTTNGDK